MDKKVDKKSAKKSPKTWTKKVSKKVDKKGDKRVDKKNRQKKTRHETRHKCRHDGSVMGDRHRQKYKNMKWFSDGIRTGINDLEMILSQYKWGGVGCAFVLYTTNA